MPNKPLEASVPSPSRPHASTWIGFAALAAIALGVRYVLAAHRALTADEIYIVFLARHGFSGMMAMVAQDVEQPLYYALAWAWRALGGESGLWAKSLSIMAGVAGVLAVVPLGRRMFGERVAWLAALLLALQRTHIEQSQKVLPASLVSLLVALAVWQAWTWFDERRARQAAVFVLCAAAALYTYWFSCIPLAVLAGYGLVRLRREPAALLRWLGLCALVVLLFGPLLPTWWAQTLRDIQGDAWLKPMQPSDLRALADKLYHPGLPVMALLAGLSAIALVPHARRGAAVLLASLILLPAVVPYLMSQAGAHLFFPAQMHFALPFVCLLLAAGAEAIPVTALAWAARAIVLLLALHGAMLATAPPGRDAFVDAADYVRQHARPGDPVVCAEPHSMLFFEYYVPGLRYRLMTMPGVEAFHYSDAVLAIADSQRTTPAQWAAELKGSDRWWGLRFEHFPIYRTGAEAAAMFTAAARGPVWKHSPATVWAGAPLDSMSAGGGAAR